MGKITWTNTTVKLGDLQPWTRNPRQSSKKQAQRLLKSWDKFGQVQTIAVTPSGAVLDGHQRLSALLTVYGKDYQVDARQSGRELTEQEREELVITLHAGAVGSWDWDVLPNWGADVLIENGMDWDWMGDLQRSQAALGNLLGSDEVDYEKAWEGMPEFEQEDLSAMKSIIVHFASQDDIDEFSELIEQGITEKTKSIWYPKREHADLLSLIAHEQS